MIYRDYVISPNEWCGFMYSHKDYDGPEDSRIGTAKTIQDAMVQIDELIEMLESGELKAYKPMDAWSGGFADNH